jgi:hypothetical protein
MNLDNKTFKREYAGAMFIVLMYLVLYDKTEMVELVIWPFLSFIATSAGLHIYDRTTSRANPSQQQQNQQEIHEV